VMGLTVGRTDGRRRFSARWRALGAVSVAALIAGTGFTATASAHAHGHGHGDGSYDPRTATVPLPQIEGPIPVTDTSHIWNGAAWQWVPIDLSDYGYVEKEYYVSGRAKVYQAVPYSDYQTQVLRSGPYDADHGAPGEEHEALQRPCGGRDHQHERQLRLDGALGRALGGRPQEGRRVCRDHEQAERVPGDGAL
jgi:hypothetical protein